jgi:hypothetical protein
MHYYYLTAYEMNDATATAGYRVSDHKITY